MSRRRYVSTQISVDKDVNRLATNHGDFAALLYTWLIPHANDNTTIPSDPEEILFEVIPGRRDKTAQDVQDAIDAMLAEGLILRDGAVLRFPDASFYRYQTYISVKNRWPRGSAQNAEDQRESAEDSDEPRESAETAASFSPSLSPSPESVCNSTHASTPARETDGESECLRQFDAEAVNFGAEYTPEQWAAVREYWREMGERYGEHPPDTYEVQDWLKKIRSKRIHPDALLRAIEVQREERPNTGPAMTLSIALNLERGLDGHGAKRGASSVRQSPTSPQLPSLDHLPPAPIINPEADAARRKALGEIAAQMFADIEKRKAEEEVPF